MFGKIIAGLIGGLIMGFLGMFLFVIATASDGEPPQAGTAFIITSIFGLVLAVTAKDTGKAWRRVLVSASVLSFALPLASFIFTGAQVTEAAAQGGEYAGAAAAGAAVGGGIVTAISGFIGFFLGVIFLIIGLLSGREKQIVIVKEGHPS